MPTSCSRCRANINCNTIARPCKNKRKKTLKVIITRELESSIYIESVRNIFSVSPQWTKSGWVWFLIVAMSRRHLFDQLLLVLSWTIVNHCAGESFLPCSSPDPPRLSLTLCRGGGRGVCFSVSGCFDSCEEKCISDTFHTWAIFLHSLSYCWKECNFMIQVFNIFFK